MPRGDRTGPMGAGPMSGRGAGFCAGYGMPGYVNPMFGRGLGMGFGGGRGWGFGGRGGGRGWRNGFYATGLTGWQRAGMVPPVFGGVVPPAAAYGPGLGAEQQIDALRAQAEYFEQTLEGIRKRIDELEAAGKKG
jgi:hypothetical protein